MMSTGLATPPRAAPRPPRSEPAPARPERAQPRERASYERVLVWSIGGSILAHILFLLLSPLIIQTSTPPGGSPSVASEAPQAFGIEMIVAIPSATAPDLPLPRETTPAPQPITRPPPTTEARPPVGPAVPAPARPPGAVTPVPAEPQGPRSAREALQPGARDPRLYVPTRPIPPPDQRTEHERYMDHLQARIDAVNDSLGVEASRNRRTSDWTVTDGSGNRWGLSPDGLHIGGITIPRAVLPLPAPTGDNQSIEAQRERERQREEIRRQADEAERRQTQDERIDATREEQNRRRGS